ncbi:hypothetical protein DFJ74DRAFT_430804 [Hyaloraphidium curvatum]|nr:hypothetical protein DFJ74DRAFT_430804 [Hyaloraphidium curvatum]
MLVGGSFAPATAPVDGSSAPTPAQPTTINVNVTFQEVGTGVDSRLANDGTPTDHQGAAVDDRTRLQVADAFPTASTEVTQATTATNTALGGRATVSVQVTVHLGPPQAQLQSELPDQCQAPPSEARGAALRADAVLSADDYDALVDMMYGLGQLKDRVDDVAAENLAKHAEAAARIENLARELEAKKLRLAELESEMQDQLARCGGFPIQPSQVDDKFEHLEANKRATLRRDLDRQLALFGLHVVGDMVVVDDRSIPRANNLAPPVAPAVILPDLFEHLTALLPILRDQPVQPSHFDLREAEARRDASPTRFGDVSLDEGLGSFEHAKANIATKPTSSVPTWLLKRKWRVDDPLAPLYDSFAKALAPAPADSPETDALSVTCMGNSGAPEDHDPDSFSDA